VLRSQDSKSFSTSDAICVESDDSSDTMATDATIPGPNSVFYYLIRAENACPVVGQGTLGSESDGTLRTGRICP
ncbi:MAG: hypothetical protein O7D35_04715, partial [Acidobacteria bacterium]|nr:hypothetical protein [Acidobacteriota bacterium]